MGDSPGGGSRVVDLVQGRLAAARTQAQHRERLALAVLTEEPPSDGSGFAAIEGVAERLLASPPPYRGGWVAP